MLEARRDASFRQRLDELGVGSEQLPTAIALLEKHGEKAGDVLEQGEKLAELEATYGKSYTDLVNDYDREGRHVSRG